MTYYRDKTGVPQTCPEIDEVIDAIKTTDKYLEAIKKTDDLDEIHDYADSALFEIYDLIDKMENLRKQNEELRSIANDKHYNCEKLMDEIQKLEKEMGVLI